MIILLIFLYLLGLLYDDLIPDENEIVETALRRLPPNEYQNRLFRFRRALNLDSQQNSLEKHEWTTPEQDVHYLQPLIKQVENEQLTKNFFDTISENPYAHRNKA